MSDSLSVRSRRLVALPAAPSVVLQWVLVFGLSYGFVLSLLWLLLRRVRAEELPGLLITASAFAALMGMIGGLHLASMFD